MTGTSGAEPVHRREAGEEGLSEIVSSDASGDLELARLRLSPGSALDLRARGRECVILILGGRSTVAVDGAPGWEVGEREDVFAGRASAVYVPPGTPYRVTAHTQLDAAIFRAPAPSGGHAYVVRPRDVRARSVGRGAFRRTVYDIVDSSRPAARLVVGETFNRPGAWSSYPPHKHDVDEPPREARLQEIYHYRLRPTHGFGLQRIYSPERGFDRAYVVHDGDSILIPFGYHPVVAAPGYELYYAWALAGEGRELHPREDPAHAWVGRP